MSTVEKRFPFTAQQFRDWLVEQDDGEVGINQSISQCPAARFLAAKGYAHPIVRHHATHLLARRGGGTLYYRTPGWLSSFIERIDNVRPMRGAISRDVALDTFNAVWPTRRTTP